jgi:hypothetical protein
MLKKITTKDGEVYFVDAETGERIKTEQANSYTLPLFCRRILSILSIVLVLVALVLIFGVIPPVKNDTFPGAAPEAAVPAFWINICLNFLSALTIFSIAKRSTKVIYRSRPVIIGLIDLFLGLALYDAASAFQNHGPDMAYASMLLFICATADFIAGIIVMIIAFLCPRKV